MERLTAAGAGGTAPVAAGPVVVWAERNDGATAKALWYADRIARGRIHVARPGSARAFTEYVERLPRHPGAPVTAVVPELYCRRSLRDLLVRHARLRLALRVLREHAIVTTDVTGLPDDAAAPLAPTALVGVVLVSRVDGPTLRAVSYARSLRLDSVRGLSVALDETGAAAVRAGWSRHQPGVPLDVVAAPMRDIGGAVLDHVRAITASPAAIAVVIVPELVVAGPGRLLHNHRALYLRRLLLLEPRVILASVPFCLARDQQRSRALVAVRSRAHDPQEALTDEAPDQDQAPPFVERGR